MTSIAIINEDLDENDKIKNYKIASAINKKHLLQIVFLKSKIHS